MQIHTENTWIVLLIAASFAFLGIIFFLIGLALYFSNKKISRTCTQKVSGTAVDVLYEAVSSDTSSFSDIRTYSYFPVYEYNFSGKTFRKKSFIGTAKPEVQKGDIVVIMVNPDNLDDFYCSAEKRKLFQNLFLSIGTGLLLLAAAAAAILFCISE